MSRSIIHTRSGKCGRKKKEQDVNNEIDLWTRLKKKYWTNVPSKLRGHTYTHTKSCRENK